MDLIGRPPKPAELRRSATIHVGLTAAFLGVVIVLRGGTNASPPPWWLLVALLAIVAVGAAVAERVPYAADPIDPSLTGEKARDAAALALARQTLRRFVITGGPLVIVVLASFLFEHGGWPMILIGPIGVLVMAVETWPSRRNVSVSAALLEAEGARTGLVDAYS